jgi:hypothetical protein
VDKWEKDFSKSAYFEKLTLDQKEESEFIVTAFAEYMYSYIGLEPKKWDEEGVEECCIDGLPRKVCADNKFFVSISPVLAAFFRYIGGKKLNPNASKLAIKVEKLHSEIYKSSSNSKIWGFAKAFVMNAMKKNIDLTNEEEMKKYTASYNASLPKKSIFKKLGKLLSFGTKKSEQNHLSPDENPKK